MLTAASPLDGFQMDDENKQLQRLLDDATLKREAAQDRLRSLEVRERERETGCSPLTSATARSGRSPSDFQQDQCEHAKGNLVNALSSDVSESSLKSFNSHATIQELAQKASSILIDLKDREQGFSKKDQQANAALSSAANKILSLERDLQTYHQALHESCGGLETSLAGVDNSVVQQTLRDSKHAVRAKSSRPSAVDEDKILYVHDLVGLVNATVQLLAKSHKRATQLYKLVNKKNEMLVMVGASLRQQATQVRACGAEDPLKVNRHIVDDVELSACVFERLLGGWAAKGCGGDGIILHVVGA
jgi:hypothetical protein